jgi:hypothetical protein
MGRMLLIGAVVVLALAQITNAYAQLVIERRCDAMHCVTLVGPPGNATTVFVPLIGGGQAQLRCTKIREEQVWPARPPMRKCGLWE